jgi:Ca-activated chloride channel family protein
MGKDSSSFARLPPAGTPTFSLGFMSTSDSHSDAWLDAELRNVPLPPGLLGRLRQTAEETVEMSDEELDATLRDVPVPPQLRRRLDQMGRRMTQWTWISRIAMAASLLVAVGVMSVGILVTFVLAPRGVNPLADDVRKKAPMEKRIGPSGGKEKLSFDASRLLVEGDLPVVPPPSPAAAKVLPSDRPQTRWPSDELAETFGPSGLDPTTDRNLSRWPETSPQDLNDSPDLRKVPGLKPMGLNFPVVAGYDLLFLSRTGFHPLVRPAPNSPLQSVVVPLSSSTASYELAQRYLDDGELPPATALRTEEFLAAIDYQFPRPTGQALGLSAAGGWTLHGGGTRLIQFGVQARGPLDASRPPARLTLLVDVSASMRWGGRLEMVRQALDSFVNRMDKNDRISLVAFSDDARVLIEDADVGQQTQIRAAIAQLVPRSSTNLGAGLRQAYAVAQRGDPAVKLANRIVLLTDGLSELDAPMLQRIDERLREAAARGIQLHVVDLEQEKGDDALQPVWQHLVSAGGGATHRATTRSQVGWALDEVLSGKSQVVAANVRLKVTFNPKAVAFYRLLGHEPRTVVVFKPAPLQTSFYVGQSATALFEVQLLPNNEAGLATAELTWQEPSSGEYRRVEQEFRREQLAGSWAHTPASVQAAAVAAEAVETLRFSPYNPPVPTRSLLWSLSAILRSGRDVNSQLLERSSYSEFLNMLEKAVRAVGPKRGR